MAFLSGQTNGRTPETFDLNGVLEQQEKNLILRVSRTHDGAQAEAARRMGLSRSALNYKLNKYGSARRKRCRRRVRKGENDTAKFDILNTAFPLRIVRRNDCTRARRGKWRIDCKPQRVRTWSKKISLDFGERLDQRPSNGPGTSRQAPARSLAATCGPIPGRNDRPLQCACAANWQDAMPNISPFTTSYRYACS